MLRPVPAGSWRAGGGLREALFGVEWVPVPAGCRRVAGRWAVLGADAAGWRGLAAAGAACGYADLAELAGGGGGGGAGPGGGAGLAAGPGRGGAACRRAGGAARVAAGGCWGWCRGGWPRSGWRRSRLVVVTRGAVAAGPGEGVTDLAGAAVWGLVRSAQSEHPGRLVLADLPADGCGRRGGAGGAAAAGPGSRSWRSGTGWCYARRLARPAGGLVPPGAGDPAGAAAAGTVLVTGGTGTLGGLVARHLAGAGRARRLVLASRSGPAAPGAAALAAELAARGARGPGGGV